MLIQSFKFLIFLGFIITCLCVPEFFQKSPWAFNLSRCVIDLSDEKWKIDPPEHLSSIFERPFYYLDKGKQSYVFVSENGDYVLKLFHVNRSQIHLGREVYWKIKKILGSKVINEKYNWKKTLQKTFDSCKIAYEKLQDLTEVEYIHLHLGQTFLKNGPSLHLRGRGGDYLLDSSRYRFIIQKKAEPLLKTIQSAPYFQKKKLLDSALRLFKELGNRGIVNTDPNFVKNYSFYKDKMILADVGSLSYSFENSQIIAEKHAKRFENFFNTIE